MTEQEQLKAKAYDTLVEIQKLQNQLLRINKKIMEAVQNDTKN